jgi:hypothetical protein
VNNDFVDDHFPVRKTDHLVYQIMLKEINSTIYEETIDKANLVDVFLNYLRMNFDEDVVDVVDEYQFVEQEQH